MAEDEDLQHGDDEESELPFTQKVAIVMVALGEEISGEVMKHLSDYEIEEITQAIAGLKNISVDIMDRILEEYEQHLMAGEWVSQGGGDFARQEAAATLPARLWSAPSDPAKPRKSSTACRRRAARASTCCAMSHPIRSPPLSATSTPRVSP